MIVEMSKIQVVVTAADKEKLLDELHERGVLHVLPVDPAAAIADEQIAQKCDDAQKAISVLSALPEVSSAGSDIDPEKVISEVVESQKIIDDCSSKSSSIKRQLDNQKLWGNVSLEDLSSLKEAGLNVAFYQLSQDETLEVDADFITTLGDAGADKKLIAVVSSKELSLPEETTAEELVLPEVDNSTLKSELTELDSMAKDAASSISQYAGSLAAVKGYLEVVKEKSTFSSVANGALNDSELFAIQGWIPSENANTLVSELESAGLPCGLRVVAVDESEQPPTKVDYPKWTLPIKALFDVLGTFPGYSEPELSKFFMVAFPLFAAMIIGDAGYGLIFMGLAFGMRDKLVKAAGRDMADLVKIIGIATFVWGMLSGNIFGVTPAVFANEAGELSGLGKMFSSVALFWDMDTIAGIAKITKLSFVIGCVHLVLAHLCQAAFIWPDKRAFAEFGWVLVMLAMFGIIWGLFYPTQMVIPWGLVLVLLPAGLALAVIFTHPHNNPVVRVSIGLASSILPTIGAFGDMMSYIRLMAVGLASYYLAASFNQMGTDLFGLGIFGVIFGSIVIVFGHALNIFLALIAVLAHGVRLNMLEFSGGAGIQWGGYAYEPFGNKK